jgi:hypothetical protein
MLWYAALLATLLSSVLVPTTASSPSPQKPLKALPILDPYPDHRPLYFSRDGTFKLLILTDTHLLDDQDVHGNASNVNRASTDAVESYLEMEMPDFVVHLGDLISGERAKNEEEVVGAIRQILGPLSEYYGIL